MAFRSQAGHLGKFIVVSTEDFAGRPSTISIKHNEIEFIQRQAPRLGAQPDALIAAID